MHSFCGDRRLRKGFGPMMTCVDRGKMAATYSLCTADCLVMTFIDGQLCLWPGQEHYIVAYPQRCKDYHGQQDRSSRPHHSRSSVHPFLASGSLSSLLAHPRHPSALFKEIIYCLLFDPRWCHLLRTVSYPVYLRCRIQSRTALQLIEKSAARIFQSPAEFFGPYIHGTLDGTVEV